MKHLRFFLLWLLLAACVQANPLHERSKAAVGKIGGCSGVCVDAEGHFLTAKHCTLPQTVTITFSDGRTVKAERVYESPDFEGPVIFDCEGEGYSFLPIASAPLVVGEWCVSYGYPSLEGQRNLRWIAGTVGASGHLAETKAEDSPKIPITTAEFVCMPGHSGGPLLNKDAEVCGLLSCSSWGSGGPRVSPKSYWLLGLLEKPGSQFITWKTVKDAYDSLAAKEVAAPSDRLVLYEFYAPWCGPCQSFERDWTTDAAFRSEIEAVFDVQRKDVDKSAALAGQMQITSLPSFAVPGEPVITGYTTKEDLLYRLRIRERLRRRGEAPAPPFPVPQAPSLPPPPAPSVPYVPSLPEPPNPTPQPPVAPEDLNPAPAPPVTPPVRPPEAPRIAPEPSPSAPSRPEKDSVLEPPVSSGGSLGGVLKAGLKGLAIKGIEYGLSAAGITTLGIGTGGIGIGVAIGWWLLKRRLKKRFAPKPESGGGDGIIPRSPFPRKLDEARQLLAIRQTEGRVAALDALRGMLWDDKARDVLESDTADPTEKKVVQQLKDYLDLKTNEIAPIATYP